MIGSLFSLVAITGSLGALPLAPSFLELYRRRDTGPVPVKNRTERVADFAHDFRDLLADNSLEAREVPARATTLVLETDSFLDEGVFFADPIYAKGSLAGGGRNVFSAIFCEKDLNLGENTEVLSWAHAQGVVIVPAGTIVHGRLSAGERIELDIGCSFERLHAPLVAVAGGAPPIAFEPESSAFDKETPSRTQSGRDLSKWNPRPTNILERITEREFVIEDFVLQPGAVLHKNLVSRGRIHLSEGSHVVGGIKSNLGMELEPNVRVEGSLVSGMDLRIGRGCFAGGPVLAEGELVIESGTQIGTPKHPTSVRAPRIRMAPGVTLHGSLWARENGQVKA
jgi:predicted acyltransferase (DUF342 family)